jgi:cell division protein FtsW (lipid II flippase)
MAVTYTRAAQRDRQVTERTLRRPGIGELVLIGVSVVSIGVMLAAYMGRMALTRRLAAEAPGAVVNLNTVAGAPELEAALALAFEHEADRRLASRELFAFIAQAGGGRRVVPNVGAIARAEVPASAIDQDTELVVYRERLRAARERAGQSGPAPRAVALVTSSELATIKPALVVRAPGAVRRALLLWGILYLAAFQAVSLVWRLRGVKGDRLLLAAAHVLTAVGLAVMIARADPLRDTMLFVRYTQSVIVGAFAMTLVSLVNFRTVAFRDFSFVPLIGALLLSVVLILFGSGPSGSNAKVNLGPVQPIEGIRVLIVLFLAAYFAKRWEVLRAVRSETVRGRTLPAWLNVPRPQYVLPVLAGVALSLALFFLQRDLGPALVISIVFLAMYAVARGGVVMTLTGFGLLGIGFFVGYQLGISSTLADRVRMWQSPWDNAARGGDQIAQSLWALATGGLWGTGLGLGDTRYLPAGHTDLVLAAAAEELGFPGLLALGLVYVALVRRGFTTARRASTDYATFLATGLTLLLAVPAALMMAGLLGLVPLTGVVTPFLSYGGSGMLANFVALGALASIRSDSRPMAEREALQKPLRWTGAVLAAAAVALAFVAARVQVVAADEIVVRPHLGMQADGSRRYQYNPRVLDVAREIPRGRVLDRRGLPLAVETPAQATKERADLQRIGISLDESCRDAAARCYPLGGRAFHLLGDARTRANWGASNTSYVEREAEAKLRGFDDHQTMIRTVAADGSPAWALRRDYRDLVPVLRHRYRPNHSAVRAVMNRPRDVRTTIDAALQVRTAAILMAHASRSQSGRAAAVVIDPDNGDLLASVSYPWPADSIDPRGPRPQPDELLDRARFGLYPPGSTFKIVTAAAALRFDRRLKDLTFTCSRLQDGRTGARVSGWGRPVRDDVLDHEPHGKIGMHEAMAVSCNAYFGQLAVRLGPEPLLDAAQHVGISLTRGNTAAQVRDALPQVGYGQAEVVATPLRMARVAAAIAADGVVPEVRWDASATSAEPHLLVTRDSARLLGRYMRDVVLDGTGRALRGHAVPIAGKTGTAEITGASSHSWFIGFAPYGQATRRVAVAVIIENAGYGATAAAPAAGEIVSAAAALGLAR